MSVTLKPTVSVVIPVYNGGDAFIRCLDSLKALDPQPLEIIVVGDGDTDGSTEAARKRGAFVLRTASRQGPANARNLGAQKAFGNILFFLDADVTLPKSAVFRVAQVFSKDPDLSALFGSYDDAPAEPGFLSQYRNLLHHYVHQNGNEHASTFWAGCGAIRREVFLSLNGFNVGYSRPSIEDIELGYRLKKEGHRVFLDKGLLVTHLKRWNALSILKTDFFNRALPWARLIFFKGGFIDDLNLEIPSRWSVFCIFVLTIFLILSLITPAFWAPVFLCAFLLCLLNRNLYLFFIKKRGALFTIGAVFWHWLYYLYSGLAFGIGLCEFGIRRFYKLSGKRIDKNYHRWKNL